MKYIILFGLLLSFGLCEECIPLMSSICSEYTGVMVPKFSNIDIEMEIYKTLNQLRCSERGQELTLIICYSVILKENQKCPNSTQIKMPCKNICKAAFNRIAACVGATNEAELLCIDLPSEDCISNSYSYILRINIILLTVVLIFWL